MSVASAFHCGDGFFFSLDTNDLIPQDELMAELEELEQEELDRNLLDVEGTPDVTLPSVPATSLPSRPGVGLLMFDACQISCCKVKSASSSIKKKKNK